MSFGPALPGGPITAADFPKNFVIPKAAAAAPAGSTSPLITTNVNQNTTFGTINITNANPGVLTLGGGGGGGVSIVQTVQNTNNVSTSQMITNTTTNTTSNNFSNQVTNTISNITNALTGGGTIGPATITPAPVIINVPSTTVTPTVTPSQTTQQTATPTQTATAGTGGGGTDYIMLLIVGAVVLGAVYFLFKGKGKKNGQ